MKLSALFTALLLQFLNTSAFADDYIKEIEKPKQVFTAKGFNNHNNAQIILYGEFSNFCQKVAPPTFSVDKKNFKIYIQNFIYISPGCSTSLLRIPYSSVVNVGALDIGKYEILTLDRKFIYEAQGELSVAKAILDQEGRDDYLYAPISEVGFRFIQNELDPVLKLSGVFTNTCMALDHVQIRNTAENTVEVLPYLTMSNTDCQNEAKPFTIELKLNQFPANTTLIHIRSMNGEGINRVISWADRIRPNNN